MRRISTLKDKLTGKLLFPQDTVTKKSYHTLTIRTDRDSGIIDEIIIPELPENVHAVGYKDIKGRKYLLIAGRRIPILVKDRVSYAGEPVLLLCGPDKKELSKLKNKIQIVYEEPQSSDEEPPLSLENIEEEVSAEESLIEDEQPEETPSKEAEEQKVFYRRIFHRGNTTDAFNEAERVIHGEAETPGQASLSYPQPSAFTKKEGDKITVHYSGRWPFNLRNNIASACSMNRENVRVASSEYTGVMDAGLYSHHLPAVHSALLATQLKKNVLVSYTAEENFLYSPKRESIRFRWSCALDASGRLLGLKIFIEQDAGAYPILCEEKVDRLVEGVTGVYRCRNLTIEGVSLKSPHPPSGAFSGLCLSEALFCAEMMVCAIAREGEEGQYLWRKNNLLTRGNKSNTGHILKKDNYTDQILDQVVRMSDFERKNSSYRLSALMKNKRVDLVRKKGIGLALGYNGNSFITNRKDLMTASIELELDKEGQVCFKTSAVPENSKLLNIWKNEIRDSLAMKAENIFISESTTENETDSGPNILNRNVTMITPLLKQACQGVRDRRFRDPLPIIEKKSTRRISVSSWDNENFKGNPYPHQSQCAAVVEVEINPVNLTCDIKHIWLLIDGGSIIDRDLAIKTIKSDITSTLGWITREKIEYRAGHLKNEDFYDYKIRPILKKPAISISFFDSGKKSPPRGIGGLVYKCLPAAYLQAVNQAAEARFTGFPVKKEDLYNCLVKS